MKYIYDLLVNKVRRLKEIQIEIKVLQTRLYHMCACSMASNADLFLRFVELWAWLAGAEPADEPRPRRP